ncbi:MAG: hypothetical protein ACYCZA_05925 [Thiobacillus sp.]
MKKMLATCFLCTLAMPLATSAGSHMRSGGDTFGSLGLSMDLGDRIFDKSGNTFSGNCSPGQSLNAYGEYGWSYYTTVFASGSLRHQTCTSGEKWGLESGQIGLARRIDPLRNTWVWEAALLLPSQRFGTQSSSHNSMGVTAGVHYHPRANPYDLTNPINPLQPNWDFGADIKSWFDGSPQEGSVYAKYTLPLQKTNWNLGIGGWSATAGLQYSQSLGGTQATTPNAVDSQDAFRRLDVSLSLRHALALHEALSIGLQTSLSGINTDDSSSIKISYEKTFPK